MRSGVTEIYLHPAVDSPEMRAFCDDWAMRVEDHRALVKDADLRAQIDRAGVKLIGFRELRALMRQ
jgi:hypothetical protein